MLVHFIRMQMCGIDVVKYCRACFAAALRALTSWKNRRSEKMEYYVKFVGYLAQIVTREEAIHAMLDFVTGSTSLYVSGGHVTVAR